MINNVNIEGRPEPIGTPSHVTFIRENDGSIYGLSVAVNVWDEDTRRKLLTGNWDVTFTETVIPEGSHEISGE